MVCIAYSKNTSYKKLKKPFKNAFPNIYKVIETTKKHNYKNFAISLQKLESKIFIDEICKKLVDVGIVPYTVHDALIIQREEQKESLAIMKNILSEFLGDIPKIVVEDYHLN